MSRSPAIGFIVFIVGFAFNASLIIQVMADVKHRSAERQSQLREVHDRQEEILAKLQEIEKSVAKP